MKITVILASNSPRRKEILSSLGTKFTVIPSNADEISDSDLLPFELACENARLKGRDVYSKTPDVDGENEEIFVISADTVVDFCGTVYGKPKDYDEAFSMLSSMSGTAHAVHTGYSVIRCSDGTEISDTETTYVTFDELSASDVENIIKGDSPYDKAGAYAIQGSAAPYICGITGCYLNVVGFPLHAIRRAMLDNFGVALEDCN
jgi:septum formation protein